MVLAYKSPVSRHNITWGQTMQETNVGNLVSKATKKGPRYIMPEDQV